MCDSLSAACADAFHTGKRESWIRVGVLFEPSWVVLVPRRLTLCLDLLGGRSWTYLESLSASRSSSGLVLCTGGKLVCIKGCVCDLYSFCLFVSLLSFPSFGRGGDCTIRHTLTEGGGVLSMYVDRNNVTRGRGGEE
jgi:hypothetical protein